jgi:chloramphenicol-sensitive protein RarD
MNPGILYATAAFVIWGLIPIYFKLVGAVPALEVLAHRMSWSLLFCLLVLMFVRRGQWFASLRQPPRRMLLFFFTALVLTANWIIYIWAVNAGHVVDSSLGYYIAPLVMVLIGAFALNERLRRPQWVAVALAAAGVAWLTWNAGQLPWIGLSLAATWSLYGALRKFAVVGAIEGLSLETALLFPVALGYLLWLAAHGQNALIQGSGAIPWLLAASGPITAAPLMLFTAGARRIPFTHLGILQYIAPTLQLLVGAVIYGEAFPLSKAAGYALIWIALAIFTLDGLWQLRERGRTG